MQIEQFLRSINLVSDADKIQRIEHYIPTSKSVPLLTSLYGNSAERAFFIIAPYGSGKSLTATYLLQVIENNDKSKKGLGNLANRVSEISPEFAKLLKKRLGQTKAQKKGIVIALHGHVDNIALGVKNSICDSLKRIGLTRQAASIRKIDHTEQDALLTILSTLKRKIAAKQQVDRICLLWDEFGRHLESLVSSGNTSELLDIQLLAEYASRSTDVPMTMGLFLHQGLLQYAGNMPTSARAEWKKIEGRFETIQYLDDSNELFRLIGEICVSSPERKSPKTKFRSLAKRIKKCKIFPGFNALELEKLLQATYPISPFALNLLPRISARVAQNERTLFTFINSVDMQNPVTTADLYDYFTPAMKADTGIGGTSNQWRESQSALSKISDVDQSTDSQNAEVEVIKTTALLGLGVDGERSHISRDRLLEALSGYGRKPKWSKVIDGLIERSLLLYRKHSNDISVWHGTDLDLRKRLGDDSDKHRNSFELIEFLRQQFPPPAWKPTRHNAEKCINRYFEGQYLSLTSFLQLLEEPEDKQCEIGMDGIIYYAIADSVEEVESFHKNVKRLNHPQVAVVIPNTPNPLTTSALETYCLQEMQNDLELIQSDPLALSEIQQLTDDSFGHLAKQIQMLLNPGLGLTTWFYNGSRFPANSAKEVRAKLSQEMNKVFDKTPRLNNEVINRKKPSAQQVNGRKKMMLNVLEKLGTEDFGMEEGNRPKNSVLRTIVLNTGLYIENDGEWAFATPSQIGDPNLKHVWEIFEDFFSTSHSAPASFTTLLQQLIAPPIGLRQGLIPVLLTCAIQAFGRSISLSHKGRYIKIIDPSVIENICKNPSDYNLRVLALNTKERKYLEGLYKCFKAEDYEHAEETDMIRLCYDAINKWKSDLKQIVGHVALSQTGTTKVTKRFWQSINKTIDPVTILLNSIPAIFNEDINNYDVKALLNQIEKCRDELDNVVDSTAEKVKHVILKTIGLDSQTSLETALKSWAEVFMDAPGLTKTQRPLVKGIISHRHGDNSEFGLINKMTIWVLDKGIHWWDADTLDAFRTEFEGLVREIEELVCNSDFKALNTAGRRRLGDLLQNRIRVVFKQYREVSDEESVNKLISEIQTTHRKAS